MATIFYDDDADLSIIQSKKVAILGYGSQGHAHALNLRDSGVDVTVGLRPGSDSRAVAEEQGLAVMDTNDAAAQADVVMVLLPDTHQKAAWNDGLSDAIEAGNALVFGHGFNVHFGFVEPPSDVDVFLAAPKSPGHIVRRLYEQGQGTPGLIAIQQDATGNALELAKSYAAGVGLTRAGVIQTTFEEETETDLFGEQAVLCGGASKLVIDGFRTLTDAGYQPEIAYFECLHELKLIVDLMYEEGIAGMRYSVSDTAEYGDLTRGPRVIDDHVRETMQTILEEIQSGKFAEEWVAESRGGRKRFHELEAAGHDMPIEKVGKELRAMMPWISAGKASVKDTSGGQG